MLCWQEKLSSFYRRGRPCFVVLCYSLCEIDVLIHWLFLHTFQYVEPRPGNVIHVETGEIVGEHQGN
jgi:hypothetical protein